MNTNISYTKQELSAINCIRRLLLHFNGTKIDDKGACGWWRLAKHRLTLLGAHATRNSVEHNKDEGILDTWDREVLSDALSYVITNRPWIGNCEKAEAAEAWFLLMKKGLYEREFLIEKPENHNSLCFSGSSI